MKKILKRKRVNEDPEVVYTEDEQEKFSVSAVESNPRGTGFKQTRVRIHIPLKVADLRFNGGSFNSLPSNLDRLSHLTTLFFENFGTLKNFPDLRENNGLTTITLSNIKNTEIPASIASAPNLRSLTIHSCSQMKSMDNFIDAIIARPHQTLKYLRMTDTNILLARVFEMTSLQSLYVNDNHHEDQILPEVPKGSNIKQISLHDVSTVLGVGTRTWPLTRPQYESGVQILILDKTIAPEIEFFNFPNICCLSLTDVDVEKLPDAIGDLSNLRDLEIHNNSYMKTLPQTMKKLKLLEKLVVVQAQERVCSGASIRSDSQIVACVAYFILNGAFPALNCLGLGNLLQYEAVMLSDVIKNRFATSETAPFAKLCSIGAWGAFQTVFSEGAGAGFEERGRLRLSEEACNVFNMDVVDRMRMLRGMFTTVLTTAVAVGINRNTDAQLKLLQHIFGAVHFDDTYKADPDVYPLEYKQAVESDIPMSTDEPSDGEPGWAWGE